MNLDSLRNRRSIMLVSWLRQEDKKRTRVQDNDKGGEEKGMTKEEA